MKKLFIYFILIFTFHHSIAQISINKELQVYADFLRKQHITAKDYVLSLFKHNDIVVLCERHHQEITQYDLFLDIIKDPYFVQNVGVVFAEVGGKNLNPQINDFLQDNLMTEEEVNKQTLYFLRNCLLPSWPRYNFVYFIRGMRDINKNLPWGNKIEFYPSNELYLKGEPTVDIVYEMFTRLAVTDSLMADNIIDKFETLKKTGLRKKALVIMNYRHAFNNKFDYTLASGGKVKNTTQFLFDRYPGKVANVLINSINISDNISTLQDGKWDAAFKSLNIEDRGFGFLGSPFGNDNFDYWVYKNNYTYNDMFTGYVFYVPVEKFRMPVGFPQLMEDGYAEKCILIEKLWAEAYKKLTNREFTGQISTKEKLMYYNSMHIEPVKELDKLLQQINKWIK